MTRVRSHAFGARLGTVALAAAGCVAAGAQPVDDSLVAVDAVWLTEVSIEGSSVFTPAELDAFTAPYENRLVSFESLQELRQTLSQAYVDRGYLTSGVVVPEQSVVDGKVVVQAVESDLTSIVVDGNHRLRDKPAEKRLEHYLDTPLNVVDLQNGLRILQKDPLVERVNAELTPGTRAGESYLHLDITERPPLEMTFGASNDRSASVGEDHGIIALDYRGLIGNGDHLHVLYGGSDGADDAFLSYGVPLTPGGIRLDFRASDQTADIVEEPFAAIDITSRIGTAAIGVSRPFIDAPDRTLAGTFTVERKRSESTLLGEPFSFSPGDVDGKARGSAVALGVEWSRLVGSRVWAARGSVQQGIDAFDSTQRETGPDSDFTLLLGQFDYGQRLGWRDGRLLARGVLQVTPDPLLAMYKLPVGGRYSVRGYRESLLVRDNGLAVSLEYQFAAFMDASGQRRGKLDLALFTDYGLSVDEEELLFATEREHLSSVGFGLVWNPLPGLHAEIYRGYALHDMGGPDESLQDRGIHYELTFRRAFF